MISEHDKCPICGNYANVEEDIPYPGDFVSCIMCGKYNFTKHAQDYIKSINVDVKKFYSCLYYYLTQYRKNSKPYLILKDEHEVNEKFNSVSVNEILNLYPKTISERIDMILINLAKINDNIGSNIMISLDTIDKQLPVFLLTTNGSLKGRGHLRNILKMMSSSGLIKYTNHADNLDIVIIDFKGWQRIDEQKKQNLKHNKGFIAMWFPEDKSMNPTREAIKEVFIETGYQISIIDEKQHNNQIVPELLYEIETSDFIVADLTGNRNGVYYEAGYALGLGKEVILTIDKNKIKEDYDNAPHFDVAQINQIRYENLDDLKIQLFNRITATVGNLKNPEARLKESKPIKEEA